VPGAVDTERFTPGEPHATGPVRILYHGRVDRRKGVLDFLQALALVYGDRQATISGNGPNLDAARTLCGDLGLASRVTLSGYANYVTVPRLYRHHHVFASPTNGEGFSNTILEAMASGLAVLSCRSVGVVDCVRDGSNGLLPESGDIPALARALTRLIGDSALREGLASTALEECRRTYSWQAVGRQIVGIYEELAGTQPKVDFDPDLPLTRCRFRAEPHLL
jgi:glycosyltransferase involved in cell wall biosynthesis